MARRVDRGSRRHRLADHFRALERRERGLLRLVARAPQPVVAWLGDQEPEGRLVDALRRLPAAQRAAVTLRYLDDLPVREVAAMLGRSEGAVESDATGQIGIEFDTGRSAATVFDLPPGLYTSVRGGRDRVWVQSDAGVHEVDPGSGTTRRTFQSPLDRRIRRRRAGDRVLRAERNVGRTPGP